VQYRVVFSDSFISEEEAQSRLALSASRSAPNPEASGPAPDGEQGVQGGVSYIRAARDQDSKHHEASDKADPVQSFEQMMLDGRRYLCTIPKDELGANNDTVEKRSPEDEKKELARATDRGRELLQDMDRCIYFVSGWWSYSFCYNKQVKQFHQLPPGNGAPPYPPTEDPTTPSYVLGRFPQKQKDNAAGEKSETEPGTDLAIQTKGDSRYLVQKLAGGTICDLTNKERQVEVQFHCHPQSPEQIGWIKEVTTCSYLMVIYTPRLCNDVAFLPPREDNANPIICQEVVPAEKVHEWKARMSAKASRLLVNAAPETRQVLGGIEIGAMKLVGREGKRIEKGKVASSNPEKTDVVAKKEGGEVKRLSKEDLKKMDLDPETVEALKKKLQDMAGDKDWKLEVVDAHGERELRGVVLVQDDPDDPEGRGEQDGEGGEGSKEEFKEEL
jgi:hypothetical protein